MVVMRVKTDSTFLCVEPVETGNGTAAWEVQVAVTTPHCMLAACEQGPVRTHEGMRQRIEDFLEHRADRVELLLPKEGWIGFQRVRSGRLTVRYCLGGLTTGAWLEGELTLEGSHVTACCRQLKELL